MNDDRLLCLASEKGKIVVNTCLDKGYAINTLKLEKLLIIMHGMMLSKYQRPFFYEKIMATNHCGLMIPKVDKDFIMYGVEFEEKLPEYVCLLDKEEEIVYETLQLYGNYDVFDLISQPRLKLMNDLCIKKCENMVSNDLIECVFDCSFEGLISHEKEVQKSKRRNLK